MSIGENLIRIKGNITAALAAIADKGMTVPDGSTSDALAELIASIEAGGGSPFGDKVFCGLYTPASDKSIGSNSDALTLSFNENSLGSVLSSFIFFRCDTSKPKWGEIQILSAMRGTSTLAEKNISGYSQLTSASVLCSMVVVSSSKSGITFYSNKSSTSLKAGVNYAWVAVVD